MGMGGEFVGISQDQSPLTAADQASHRIIQQQLQSLYPAIPILSEEGKHLPYEERKHWETFWLIDPLDGTKEFIKKNGEFTVNIALVNNGTPVLGVVYAPAIERLYWAAEGQGAWREEGRVTSKIQLSNPPHKNERPWRVVGSRSHGSEAFQAFTAALPSCEIVSMGSSLKLCLVADGSADIYPRLGPTSEWDTAAAHCVVNQAGGKVICAETGEPLIYNRQETLLNPWFIVSDKNYVPPASINNSTFKI